MAKSRTVQKNYCTATLLYQQGENHPYVYRIVQGYVVLSCETADGKGCVVDLLSEGDYFGPGLLGSKLRTDSSPTQSDYSALAKPGCQLSMVKQQDFWAALQDTPTEAIELAENLSRRENRLRQQIALQSATLEQRLAVTLDSLFDRAGMECRHGHKTDIKFSQQELANMVGSSRQSVSRLLADWRRDGVIDYTRAYLCLNDSEKLRAYARY